MADAEQDDLKDTLKDRDEPRSSARILDALNRAERAFNQWNHLCDEIDDVYAKRETSEETWSDPEYDLFWSSTEVLKPAIYARPPQPVVSPQFKDRRKLYQVTAELLERTVASGFDRTGLDEAMLCARDDLIFYNRGQLWVVYEDDDDGQRFCVDHVDRKDFRHPPARRWSDVPWVARRAWLTERQWKRRFKGKPGADRWGDAEAAQPRHGEDAGDTNATKRGAWEVWHREDKKVYWVAVGVDVILDEDKPHLSLHGFFPCPRPAYGTLRPRTLEPKPDYIRYAPHFAKINSLTRRIYALLDQIRMKGLIPAGGDVGNAVEQAMSDDNDATLLIPVPAAALVAGSSSSFVQWLPLAELATAITGLIEARRELFADFDRLSGISDIMRGETEAEETLGAQRLKSQYGSTRVREKVDELQRLARDMTKIAAEIAAEKFSQETLLDMSQMEIATKADIQKRTTEAKNDAKAELESLGQKAKSMIEQARTQGQEVDPQAAEQQFEQAKQQVLGQFKPIFAALGNEVPIEDVMKLLRDDKARGFAFEIATDSTILVDEMQEKASRNEFLTVFSGAVAGLSQLATLGEAGAKLAGGILKFTLQPWRVGRELDGLIDDFVDAAPEMAAQAQGDGGDAAALAEANNKLADAEIQKAKAATMKVQADMAKNDAEGQRKMAELQTKMEKDRQDFASKMADAETRAGDAATKADLTSAQIDKLRADTAKILNSIGLDVRKQDLDEYRAATDTQLRVTDQTMGAQRDERDAMRADRQQMVGEHQSHREHERADRQQDFSERQGERADQRADRQQSFSEEQARREAVPA